MKQPARTDRSHRQRVATSCLLAWLVALGAPARLALAGPEGAKVVRGKVSIEKVGDTTLIHASNRSIIKFSNFDIGAGETVQFIQPNAKASVLNKINSARPTQIDGALLANGRVYLVNRAGVYFGVGAEVNVGELVAAAGHIRNADFLAGVDRFSDLTGSVRNDGSIHADVVELVGAHVANSGQIDADGGWIAMVSGNDVLLGQTGSRLYVKIAAAPPGDAASAGVEQSGSLSAEGGAVLLAGGDALGLAILHSGETRADRIEIAGGDAGIVEVSGTLDASDREPGGQGGRIEVTGDRIALRAAQLDASGDAGGGRVLVGGDFQGGGDVRTADVAFVDPDTHILADALAQGNGGKVIVWADGITGFHGEIDARGGAAGGDGGLVEVSGKHDLVFRGDVDTSAPQGDTGLLLLDPANLTIANGVGDGDSVGAPDGTTTFAGDPSGITGSVLFADTSPTTIFESELEGLAASTNVLLQATNSIVMQDLTDNVLALPATGTVTFQTNGTFQMDPSDTIRTEGASIAMSGLNLTLGSLSTRGAGNNTNGAINVTGAGGYTVRGVDAGTAAVALASLGGSIADDGSLATRVAGGSITINANGANASIGSLLAPLSTSASGALTASANNGTGGIFVSEGTIGTGATAGDLSIATINGGTTKTISLRAEAGSITGTNANNLIAGSTLSLTADGAAATIGTNLVPIRATLGGVLNASKPNGTGAIFVTSVANALQVGSIDAGAGNVTLNGSTGVGVSGLAGSILDDGMGTRITANNLNLNATVSGATVGISTAPIGTNLSGTLNVSSATGPAGSIAVSELSGLELGIVNGGTTTNAKNVFLTAEAGSITGSSATNLTSGATLSLTADGTDASVGTGAVPVRTNFTGAVTVSSPKGTGDVFLSSGSASAATATPLRIGSIDAGQKNVSLTGNTTGLTGITAAQAALAGSILDDSNPSTRIVASSLTLTANHLAAPLASEVIKIQAGATIGTNGDPIGINVSNLSATSRGAMFIEQSQGGDLTLGTLNSMGAVGTSSSSTGTVGGVSGGIQLRNDAGTLLVNGPITTFSGSVTPAFVSPGSVELDSPRGIVINVDSLTSGGDLLLNTNESSPSPPVLATIFRQTGDLTLTATHGSVEIGQGQVLTVPGTLTLNAVDGVPANGGGTPPTDAIPGRVTVGDVNALDIVINAQQGDVRVRAPRTLYLQDGRVLGDGGVDLVANTIEVNIADGMGTVGSGPPPTFSTPEGNAVANAPPGSRFGVFPNSAGPLTPASFVGTGGAATGRVLDLQGTGSTTEGTPDAVAPVPYVFSDDPAQLGRMNAEAAGLSPIWGSDILAYLRCSKAPGDDPDAVPVDCLGYDPAQQGRAPFTTPEAFAARSDYRELLAARDALRADLASAYEAYRAQAPDATPSGADFRHFVEQDPAHADAANALRSLRELLDSLGQLQGAERAPAGVVEPWQQKLLQDFTPGGMSPALLYEATGAGSGRVDTAELEPRAAGGIL